MNYDFISNKNLRDYRNQPDYEIKSENSSINSDNNKDSSENELVNKKNSEDEISSDNDESLKSKYSTKSLIEKEDYTENEKELINLMFVDFKKKYNPLDKKIWWPVKVKYSGNSYYPMTKKEYLIKYSTYNIINYCNNHLLNT